MEPKTFVFPDSCGSNNDAMMMAAMNGGLGGGMCNNPIWALIFLIAISRNGLLGGNGSCVDKAQLSSIQEQLNTNQGQTLLMDAIKDNAGSLHELASSINCDINAVQTAINSVQSAICNVSNQVGMTSAQVINAIQNGNMSLANTLQSCCCDIRESVTKMGYDNQINNLQQSNMIQKGFGDLAFATQAQTTMLSQNADANARAILDKLDAIEDSRKDREIATLTAQLASANARAERQAELAPIFKALSDIQNRQPNTVSVPYPQLTAIPTAQLYGSQFTTGGFL